MHGTELLGEEDNLLPFCLLLLLLVTPVFAHRASTKCLKSEVKNGIIY